MGKYLAYPEYKSTGVEWFTDAPAGWGVLTARRVFKQVRDPANPDDEQLAATQKYGVIPQRLFMEYQDQKVVLALAGTGNFKHVEVNDFVISLRSFQGGIERCHYEGCVSPAYTVMRRDKAIDPAYFSFLLKSEGFITALQSVTQGIREGKTITYEQFGSISVPFPTMGEQQHIAAFLDHETAKIDRLIAKQERLIELLKEKRQAVISHAVTKGLNPDAPMKDTGVEWLGDVPAHWQVKSIKRLTVVKRGASPRPIDDQKYFDEKGHYAWVRIADATASGGRLRVTTQRLSHLGASLSVQLQPGDLFLSIAGTVGLPCITEIPACIHDGFVYFPEWPESREYLFYIFQAGECYKGLGKFGTQLNLNTDTVGFIKIGVPPRAEQDAIVGYINEKLAKLDGLVAKAARAVSLLHEHRTALISAAVTGKIDVRDWQQPNNDPQEAAAAASA